jgi:hypothetical protein
MQAARGDQLAAAGGADRQIGGGGHRGGALVERGVRNRQAGELGHRRLELEHHLEPALGDLGLIGRVRGQELRAAGDRVDDRRHVVVVHPSPEEARLRLGVHVPRRQLGQPVVDLGLGLAVGQLERAVEPQGLGDVLEELVDRDDADGAEHLPAVLVGGGGVPAHRWTIVDGLNDGPEPVGPR